MPGGKGVTVSRMCDVCGGEYQASVRRLERGWDTHCSKTCANTQRSRIRAERRRGGHAYQRQNSSSRFKEETRRRAGYKCEGCGISQQDNGRALDVHRIIPATRGGRYEQGNVRALCIACHQREEQE